ncbi:hypothetical protein EJB05_23359, partial [Eragrostis curvula]
PPGQLSKFELPPTSRTPTGSLLPAPRLSPPRSPSAPLSTSFSPSCAASANPSPPTPTCEPGVSRPQRLVVPRAEQREQRPVPCSSGIGLAEMDRKRIKDALERHLERSSPSTSRGAAKERERLAAGKLPASLGKAGKVSDGGKSLEEEFETDSEDSDVSGSEGEDTSWISWFCSLRGNEFFCEIDDDYIQDDFNLCGLSNQVPYYDYALDLILDIESSNGDVFTEEQNELIESSAEMLYGLIHSRYILTSKGLAAMLEKFKNYDFGRCPRVYCCGQPCLPAGQSDIPRSSTVKIYCPKCEELHYPRSKYQGSILFLIYLVHESSVITYYTFVIHLPLVNGVEYDLVILFNSF